MDDRGFVFTADSTLALVVLIVFTASIMVYSLLPVYQGQDHQHLQALADSTLATMEADGTLRDAAVYYANNDTAKANAILTASLNSILPSDVSYKMTMNGYSPQAINNRGRDYALANDVATGVRIISGPKEGWLGRSTYNIKEVGLRNQATNVTTTLWNFHNWLTNFPQWNPNQLNTHPYWGYTGGSYQNVAFSVPNTTTGTVNWARFIINSAHKNSGTAYRANVFLNNHQYSVPRANFQYLYDSGSYRFYNNRTSVNPSHLTPGSTNNLYVQYQDVSSYNDMAWFSLIANYPVNMVIPQGVVTKRYNFGDLAGQARSRTSNQINGMTYNLDTGAVATFTGNTNQYRYSWNTYTTTHPMTPITNNRPFVITSPPGNYAASAVAIEKVIDNTDSGDIKDAYLVMNPYGAVDGAMVEVYHYNTNTWETVFRSDWNTGGGTSSGYGNLPGILNLKGYMDKGFNNKVRITIWDNVPSDGSVDYDLVGLTDCYAVVSSTKLPIWWDEYAVTNQQSGTGVVSKDITYEVRNNQTKEAYLFFSGGLDTQNVQVQYVGANTGTLYNGPAPYLLNLGELDSSTGLNVMTNGTPANHTYFPGNYTIRVTVTANSAWASGDSNYGTGARAFAEIFSGTRVAVIYPALENAVWSDSYAPTAQEAIDQAYQKLIARLQAQGFYDFDPNLFFNESMYTGDLPNSIPVRLDLWTYSD